MWKKNTFGGAFICMDLNFLIVWFTYVDPQQRDAELHCMDLNFLSVWFTYICPQQRDAELHFFLPQVGQAWSSMIYYDP